MARNYDDDGNLAGPYARDERHDGFSDDYAREQHDADAADGPRSADERDDVHIGKASE